MWELVEGGEVAGVIFRAFPAGFGLREGSPGEWRGVMSRLLYQEGLTTFCLGSQKSCQAFLTPDGRDHHVQIEESCKVVFAPISMIFFKTRPGHLFDLGVPMMTK